jgi:hypothetical protein
MRPKKSRRLVIAVAIGVLTLVSVGAAIATRVSEAGGTFLGTQIWSDTVTFSGTSTTFQTLPGTTITVGIASGNSSLIEARFTAESSCFGGAAGNGCSLRVVARNISTGTLLELHPASGDNFRFDSVSSANDGREGHAMERSFRLPAGGWNISVQWKTTSSSTTFVLDDWHFAVDSLD